MFPNFLCKKLLVNFRLQLIRNFRTRSNWIQETHYNTLNLPRNCSFKDIRTSFLKLSKEYHPDKNKNKDTHNKFVKISEAYNVLSKPASRYKYDISLSNQQQHYSSRTNPNVHVRTQKHGPWTSENVWYDHYNTRRQTYESVYPGMNRVNSVPNAWVVYICMGITTIGIILQIIVVKSYYGMKHKQKGNEHVKKSVLMEDFFEAILKSQDQQKNALKKKITNTEKKYK